MMPSDRRSTRARTTKQSYVEVPEDNEDNSGDEASSPVTKRSSKRRRPVVIDTDDESDEVVFASTAFAVRATEQATASVPNFVASATQGLSYGTFGSEQASASVPNTVATAAQGLSYGTFAISGDPNGTMPAGDEDQIIADIAAVLAAGIDVDEDSDEDEEDDTSLDPDFVVEDDIVDESNLAVNDVVLEDVEVEPDFARKLRVILDTLCQWAGNISYPDFKALAKEDRPVTLSVWKVLKTVGVDFLLVMYLAAIPLRVQKLFLKQEWCLDDFLSLPEVEEEDASDQGLYGNFPTGRWERAPKIGCECYVGSAKVFQRRINDHLKISRQYDVSELPEGKNRSFHYRTTCREGVSCNFRKLAQFKRPIHAGYLVILEGIFMVLFGTYNYPGYCSQWATQPSYDLVKNLRASLDVPAIPWKGLNAAWPLRQGFVSQGGKAPSECCNAACKTMTYPRNMMPEGPKHPRAIADSWNPLGGYLCRRCESYRERRGVLPDNATLVKLVSQYTLEVTKSNSRLAGQTVICADCGAVEGSDGARNSANGYGTRHIATNGKIQCSACYGYVAKYGKKRDNTLSVSKAAREQADADRKAGRPVLCKHCLKAEGTCKKKHVASKSGGMICQQCYQKKHLR